MALIQTTMLLLFIPSLTRLISISKAPTVTNIHYATGTHTTTSAEPS